MEYGLVMPRQPRFYAPGTLHHEMGRVMERIEIFRNKVDQEDLPEVENYLKVH